jgi:hypothetical protein
VAGLGGWGSTLALILVLLTTACTTRVTGYVSPLAHDYGVVEWRSLEQTVDQRFVAGPGHQAAIANDGKTTPVQFQERLAALPEDARTGTLLELAVGLRLEGANELEPSGVWDTGARLQLIGADAAPILDLSVDGLPRDGDWLTIEDPPTIVSGQVVSLRIVPGDGPDADRLRYGVIPDRAPYGGWFATNAAGDSAGGALLARTAYERNVALGSVVSDGLANLRDAARDDLLFGAAWALALAGMLAGAGWLWRLRPARDA